MITMRFSRRALLSQGSALVGLGAVACVTEKPGADTGLSAAATGGGGAASGAPLDEIPPITSNEDHYVTSCCGSPTLDRDAWRLALRDRTAGQDRALGSLSLADLQALGGRDKEHTLQCIGSGPRHQAIGNAVWTGLPLREALDALGFLVPAAALELYLEGADAYTTAVPVSDLDRPIWIVWAMNGEPLPRDHGGVVRLLVPGRYGMKNVKWLVALHFIDQPHLGFWEEVGWSNDCTIRANAFIASPTTAVLDPGDYDLLGTAFAGEDPIATVEVSLDDGATWAPAEITYPGGPSIWTLWRQPWTATPGGHRIRVRATTQGGQTTGDPAGSDPYSGYDGGMAWEVIVNGA